MVFAKNASKRRRSRSNSGSSSRSSSSQDNQLFLAPLAVCFRCVVSLATSRTLPARFSSSECATPSSFLALSAGLRHARLTVAARPRQCVRRRVCVSVCCRRIRLRMLNRQF
ncbi:hypothetical protein ANCDUO_00289 [Ancylostoma duodenale]|uniref:Uncharacterized protein n=1 Tax=Ancylostoma duodenale TaxID=51022 RepID=A0A0C2HIH1_9BILA|nr:hypothetical protein ANCDUO_00289 [Ancylostoma duodenale]